MSWHWLSLELLALAWGVWELRSLNRLKRDRLTREAARTVVPGAAERAE